MSRASPVQDPRIAKKEMIITRFKSAQQKKQQQGQKEHRNVRQLSKTPQNTSKMTQNVSITTQIRMKSPQTVSKAPQGVTKTQETITKISPTVKSVPPKSRSSKKGSPKKSSIKPKEKRQESKSPIVIEDEYPEYYPDKLKRDPGTRKVFLKPKQKSTMIARTNKRKFNTPKRGIKSPLPEETNLSETETPECQSPVYSELSMAEVIRIVEENDSLDDEDLMEILTCPSPVWWEEPPDEMYIEEAICSRKPEENSTGKTKSPIRERCLNTLRNSVKLGNKIITQTSNTDTNTTYNRTEVKKDDKFIKKSKKLENVLGNIKNKVSESNLDGKHCNNHERGDDRNSSELESDNISNVVKLAYNADVVNETDKDNTNNDQRVEENIESKYIKIENDANAQKIKKLSECTEDSLDLNQELLVDFENVDIPIRNSAEMNSPDCVIINDDTSNKIIDVDDLECKSDHENKNFDSSSNAEIKSDVNGSNHVTIEQESKEMNSEITDVVNEVPKDMPPLIKCPKIENPVFPSPNSYKSISDDVTESSSISGVDGMDTISDSNIKFITDDDVDDVSDGDSKNKNDEALLDNEVDTKDERNEKDRDSMTELNELAVLRNLNDMKSKDAYITVYKIVPNDDAAPKPKNKFKNIPEYSSYVENLIQSETKADTTDDGLENDIPDIPIDTKGQLNSFFKKCKNANRKRKRVEAHDKIDNETCKSPKKSITVAQDENVKYCMKCSSIFDTEDCSYCLKNRKDVEKSETEKSFTCDKCDFVGESKSNVSLHLEEHVTEEEEKT